MMGLTRRQQQCMDFLRAYHAEHGIVPSHGEISVKLKIFSKSGVVRLLDALEERGHIRRSRRKARSIEIISPDQMNAVLLSREVFTLVQAYAASQRISVDVAVSEIVREAMGAA